MIVDKTRMQREYEKVKERGLLGHRSDPKWNAKAWRHDCCGSRAYWRHKIGCPYATGDGSLPPDA
jgi:hypothetical protein